MPEAALPPPADDNQPEEKPEKPRRRPVRRRAKPASAFQEASNKQEINDYLTTIYRDESGRVPNMQKIAIKKGRSFAAGLVGFLTLFSLAALGMWAWKTYFSPGARVADNQVTITLNGPTEVTAGEPINFSIQYANRQAVDLRNVVLRVNYPASFFFSGSSVPASNARGNNEWNLGTIASGKTGAITITGSLYGPVDSAESWRAFLTYQPANFNSELQTVQTLTTRVAKTPFMLSVTSPNKIIAGTDTEISFVAEYPAGLASSTLEVVPAFPASFRAASSSPRLNKQNIWSFVPAATSTKQKAVFKVRGAFSAASTGTPALSGALRLRPLGHAEAAYILAATEAPLEISTNAVTFNLAINGSLTDFDSRPGDILNLTVRLKNTSNSTIKNATVRLMLEAPSQSRQSVLKWADLVDEHDGAVQGEQVNDIVRRGIITWTPQKVAALAALKPNDEALFDVRLPIKDSDNADWGEVAAASVQALATTLYTDQAKTAQAISSNPMAITLNSDLRFESRDSVGTADNKEQHAITWVLNNSYHALKNVTLSATLFGDVNWLNTAPPPSGEVVYDPKEKKITWTIPEMPLGVDVLALPFTVTLNAKNPSQNTLVSKVRVQADDTVTQHHLDFTGNEILLNQ